MILNIFSCPALIFYELLFPKSCKSFGILVWSGPWKYRLWGRQKKPWNDLFSVWRSFFRQGCSWVDYLWVTQGCSVITTKMNNQDEKPKEENHGQDILVAKEMTLRRGDSLPMGLTSSSLFFGDTRIQFSMKKVSSNSL